jgi:hypothetical protein
LVESWNGSSWSTVPSPNTSPSRNNILGRLLLIKRWQRRGMDQRGASAERRPIHGATPTP